VTGATAGDRRRWRGVIGALVLVAAVAAPAMVAPRADAQEFHGFVEGLNGARTASGAGFETGSYTARETRLQLTVGDYSDDAEYFARFDLPFDQVGTDASDIELREAHLSFGGFEWFDFKVGRQILTWGTGDLLFINDVFPKDWQSFFIGRETQYLKAPSDAVRFGVYVGGLDLNLALLPRFEPDRLPTPERLAFYDPLGGTVVPDAPGAEVEKGELALRVKRTVGGVELAGYGYVGYFRQPLGFDGAVMRLFYPRLNVYGGSVRWRALGGIANAEVGYYDSRDDPDGTRAGVENSSVRWMVGYDRPLWTDFQLGAQAYVESRLDHDAFVSGLPAGAFVPEETRQLLTLRLTQDLDYQTIQLSLFTFVSPSDDDLYVRAAASYKLSDPVVVLVGANVFEGDHPETLFGQLDANDNVYVRVRYSF